MHDTTAAAGKRTASHPFKALLKRWSWEQAVELLTPLKHSSHIRRHRAELIISRVQIVSAIFAVLTPLWIVLDVLLFPWPLWGVLTMLRLGSSAAFTGLAWPHAWPKTNRVAWLMLSLMLAIPPVFYLISHPFFAQAATTGLSGVVVHAYSLLPVIVVAGLSVFPLTALEVVASSLPVLGVCLIAAAGSDNVPIEALVDTLWLLGLVMGVSVFSGMSQLNYMIALINQASHDVLTGAFTRRSGEEAMDLQFRIAARTDTQLSVAFLDVDNFKSVNDTYGHEEGDRVLRSVADHLRTVLRRSDTLIRWGGEEFLVMMPITTVDGVAAMLTRLRDMGLGLRPDGRPVTASVGVSERSVDKVDDWMKLIEIADERMYQAKKSGKNRSIGPEGRRMS